MSIHHLHQEQQLPISIEEAWNFMASPHNLQLITPASLAFKVLDSNLPSKIYTGLIINYRIKPLLGIPMHWQSLITEVKPLTFFIDEQKKGPYKSWKHQHYLKAIPGGVEMKDHIEYQLPFGFIGDIVHTLLIKQQVRNIFTYRREQLIKLFGTLP